jgi:hypothetical protein
MVAIAGRRQPGDAVDEPIGDKTLGEVRLEMSGRGLRAGPKEIPQVPPQHGAVL